MIDYDLKAMELAAQLGYDGVRKSNLVYDGSVVYFPVKPKEADGIPALPTGLPIYFLAKDDEVRVSEGEESLAIMDVISEKSVRLQRGRLRKL